MAMYLFYIIPALPYRMRPELSQPTNTYRSIAEHDTFKLDLLGKVCNSLLAVTLGRVRPVTFKPSYHEKLQIVLLVARSASFFCSLKFLLERTRRRAWRAMIIATHPSILRDDFGLSLAILIPQRFGRRRALITCRPRKLSPSCKNVPLSISLRHISAAIVNSAI